MRIPKPLSLLITACSIIILGCGENHAPNAQPATDAAQKLIQDLQTQLTQARENLARQQDRNSELIDRLQGVVERLNERERAASAEQGGTVGSKGEQDDGRIQLMGQKALAEYKADQLALRVDKLSLDLDRKEQELETIRTEAEQKDTGVRKLTKSIDELQEAEKTRTAELNSRLQQIGRELDDRTATANKLKSDLEEKTELLAALKNAVGDASRLKSGAEAEIARKQSELDQAYNELAITRENLQKERQEVARLSGLYENAREDISRYKLEFEQWKAEAEHKHQQLDEWIAEADRRQQEIEAERVGSDRSRQENEQLKAELERLRQEIVIFRVDSDKSRQEAQDLRVKFGELSNQMRSMEAKKQVDDKESPSTVERLLEGAAVDDNHGPVSSFY